MNLQLSEDQALFQSELRRFLFANRNANHGDLSAFGIFAALLPEQHGGMGFGAVEMMVIAEELGRAVNSVPFVDTAVIGAGLIARFGSDKQKAKWLPLIGSGDIAIILGWAEPYSRDPLQLRTIITGSANRIRLTGLKAPVVLFERAGPVLVVGTMDGKLGIAMLTSDTVEVAPTYRTIDGLPAASLTFCEFEAQADALLGGLSHPAASLTVILDHAVVAQSSELVGLMATLLNATRDQLRNRRQFGSALASFQALQHRFANMYIAYELARSAVMKAAVTCAGGGSDEARMRAVSAAKQLASQGARLIGHEAIQMHGAMGMTEELIVGPAVKRIRALEPQFGSPASHVVRYADTPLNEKDRL